MSERKIMALAVVAVVLIMFLGGCTPAAEAVRPVRVVERSVPILEIRPVPEELLRKPIGAHEVPEFVAKEDPAATSCLTPEGEARLRMLMIDRESRIDAWEKWGILP